MAEWPTLREITLGDPPVDTKVVALTDLITDYLTRGIFQITDNGYDYMQDRGDVVVGDDDGTRLQISVRRLSDGFEHIPGPGDNKLWWLSFCDPDLPEGSQFLGVAIISAPSGLDAVHKTWDLDINPGGEIQFTGPMPLDWIGPEWRDRLLTRDEAHRVPPPKGASDA